MDAIPKDTRTRLYSRTCSRKGPLDTDCVEWLGAVNNRGYGVLHIRLNGESRVVLTHRLAYVLAHGVLPPGESVHHHCDNRRCMNPEHLVAGPHRENMLDMAMRERNAKELCAADVIDIRKRAQTRGMGVVLAEEYGVSRSLISQIKQGGVWGWVA